MEKLDKSKIAELLKSDFDVKKANIYLVIYFVFVALLEVYVYFKHGMDSIVKNWVSVPLLLVGGVAVYAFFRGFNSLIVKSAKKAIEADNIVVLETKVVKVKKGDTGLAELYFTSKHYGKHNIIVDGVTACEAKANETRYYLVLTKEKKKFVLLLALPASEWVLDSDLDKYKACEL